MEKIISASLITSLLMAAIAFGIVIWRFCRSRKALSRGGVSTYLAASFFLFLSILLLRFAEFYYASYTGQDHVKGIVTGWEDLVAGTLASLRTFSMEEAYGDFLPNLRAMMEEVFPGRSDLVGWTVAHTTVLNIIAPIAGGAIILEILANFFPKLKFLWARYLSNRVKAYFSELNPESLAMAKSLSHHYSTELKKRKPVLIFTDVYIDDETEKEYELLLEAKHMGAVCIRDDLAHIAKRGWGKRSYFLMDQNEFGNLQTLVALSEDRNARYTKNAEIYLFVQSDAYIRLEQQIRKRLTAFWKGKKTFCKKWEKAEQQLVRISPILAEQKRIVEKQSPGKDGQLQSDDTLTPAEKALNRTKKEEEEIKEEQNRLNDEVTAKLPTIVPVFGFRNLVLNLFSDVPLYEPLIRWKDKKKLRITILGSGTIGTEAFLNAYWMGQMMIGHSSPLTPCDLNIHILSKEKEEDFLSKLDYISPEIRNSLELELAEEEKPEEGKAKKAKIQNKQISLNGVGLPYAKLKYTETDIKIGSFWNNAEEECKELLDSDYLIVALGTDLDNISVAEKLRTFIGQKQLTDESATDTVIAYAVFNSELCATLNRKYEDNPADRSKKTAPSKTKGKEEEKPRPKIHMHAFGSLEQVYCTDNVFLSESKILAEEMGDAYLKQHNANAYITEHAKRSKDDNRNFTFWANISRVRHTKYKLFSLGWIDFSLFDPTGTDAPTRAKKLETLSSQYRRIATLPPNSLNKEDKAMQKKLEPQKHRLAWLEHRRWCAFTRTMGFRSTTALLQNLLAEKSHKNMPLKLHPCLVEANCFKKDKDSVESFIHGKFNDDGRLNKDSVLTEKCKSSDLPDIFDPLDRLSYDWKKLLDSKREYMKEKDIDLEPGDFKQYDYYRYEYNHCILFSSFLDWNQKPKKVGKPSHVPHLTEEYLKHLCTRKKKAPGILPYKSPHRDDDYIIPISYLHEEIRKTFHAVDKKTEPDLLEKCKDNKEPNAFCFEDIWFVHRKPKFYRRKTKWKRTH